MRILSDFHDYYDIGMKYDQSGYPIWKRKTGFPIMINIQHYLYSEKWFDIIGFAGDTFLFVDGIMGDRNDFHRSASDAQLGHSRNYKEVFLYNEYAFDVIENSKMWGDFNNFHEYIKWYLNDTKRLFKEYETPIFKARFNRGSMHLETAPILKDIKFQKVIDPYSAYQKLDQYVGTHMVQEIETIALTDDSKAKKAGFGDKYDFRRLPKRGT